MGRPWPIYYRHILSRGVFHLFLLESLFDGTLDTHRTLKDGSKNLDGISSCKFVSVFKLFWIIYESTVRLSPRSLCLGGGLLGSCPENEAIPLYYTRFDVCCFLY